MHGHDAGRRVVLSVDSVEQMVVANADLDRYEARLERATSAGHLGETGRDRAATATCRQPLRGLGRR